MPAKSSQSSSTDTFVRHIAPFAPLALALGMSAVSPTPPPAKSAANVQAEICNSVSDFQDCHSRYPTGCSKGGRYDAYLNLLKDEVISPPASSALEKYLTKENYVDLDANTPADLTKTNHATFEEQLTEMGEGQTYGLIGFLYYYEPTGAESSNCDLTGPPGDPEKSNVDYHIGIGFDATTAQGLRGDGHADALSPMARRKPSGEGSTKQGATPIEQTSVIVEMTPHTRAQFQSGVWTLENLQKAVGRQVRVIGQLLIDNEHNSPSDNCATASTAAEKISCWRFSIWELHPVERFEVCSKTTNDCTQDDTDNWKELNQI